MQYTVLTTMEIPAYNDYSCIFLLNSNIASTNIASTDSTASKHKEKH